MRTRTTFLLCLPLLAGCSKPISYYAAHADERTARVEACLEEARDSHDCRNATQAAYDAVGIKAVDGRALPISPSRIISIVKGEALASNPQPVAVTFRP
jgi:hypothetical protein